MISTDRFDGMLHVECRRQGVIMEPDGSVEDIEGILNPGVTRDRQGRLLFYPRMVAAGNVSSIGVARSRLGEIERLGIALQPVMPYEQRSLPGGYGCEDARVTYVPALQKYLMAYTAFGPEGARVAFAVSDDAYFWIRLGPVDFGDDALNAVDNKDAAFFPEVVISPAGVPSFAFFHRPMRPETINGQTPIALILDLPAQEREATCIAYVPADRVLHNIGSLCMPSESIRVLEVGETWGRLKNGAGTPPVRTRLGWLSVFHAVDVVTGAAGSTRVYSAGIMINDAHSPHRLVYRSPEPILTPETSAERFGTVDDVVFPTGIDEVAPDVFDIYYGAADARISRARIEISGL